MPRSPPLGMDLRLLGPIEARLDERPIALGARQAAGGAGDARARRPAARCRPTGSIEGLWGEQPPAERAEDGAALRLAAAPAARRRRRGDRHPRPRLRAAARRRCRRCGRASSVCSSRRSRARGARAVARRRRSPTSPTSRSPPPRSAGSTSCGCARAELAIDADLAAGRHDEVIGELETLVAAHPLRERLHAQRMLALYRCRPPGRGAGGLPRRAPRAGRADRGRAGRRAASPARSDPAPRTRRSTSPRRRRRNLPRVRRRGVSRACSRSPRCCCSRASLAFGVSRVLEPDSLPGIREDARRADRPRRAAGSRTSTASGTARRRSPPAPARCGSPTGWTAPSRGSTAATRDRDDRRRRRADRPRVRRRLAVGRGRPGPQGRADRPRSTNKVVQPDRRRQRRATPSPSAPARVWVASAVDATVARIDLTSGKAGAADRGRGAAVGAGGRGRGDLGRERGHGARDPARSALGDAAGHHPRRQRTERRRRRRGSGVGGQPRRRDRLTDRPGHRRVTETVPVGREPRAIAADEDGVWVANAGDGTVMRIDPRSRDVTNTVDVESSPAALAVVDGTVWTAALAPTAAHRGGTLRVEPLRADPGDAVPDRAGRSTCPPTSLVLRRPGRLPASRRLGGRDARGRPRHRACRSRAPTGGRTSSGCARTSASPTERPSRPRTSARRSSACSMLPHERAFLPDVPAVRERRRAAALERCDLANGHRDRRGGEDGHLPSAPARPRLPAQARQPRSSCRPASPAQVGEHAGAAGHRARTRSSAGTRAAAGCWSATRTSDVVVARPARRLPRRDRHPARAAASADRRGRARRGGRRPARLARSATSARSGRGTAHGCTPTRYRATSYVFLNVLAPPFDDPRVRRALNFAVDRGRVAELFGSPGDTPADLPAAAAGLPGYTPTCPFTR